MKRNGIRTGVRSLLPRPALALVAATTAAGLSISCGKKVEAPPAQPSYSAETNEDAIAAKVGCARCLHKMANVGECTPAIRVGDRRPMLAEMATPPAGETSICDVERDARIVGDVEGGVFYALDVFYLPGSESP